MVEAVARVGLLGLGSMGGPIAVNIARQGFEVLAYDPRREALEAVAEAGIRACASPAEVAAAADLTLAIPYDYSQVEQAVFGPGGVVEGWSSAGLFVMMSTVGPDNARALGGALADRGHHLIDAPVSGGHGGATAGTLTIMVGATDQDLALARPVLEAFSKNIFHVGQQPGAGQAAKLVNQLLVVAHHVATAEALMLATRSGCDLQQIYNIITTSAGNSSVFAGRAAAILNRSFETGSTINILVKDAHLVLAAAQASGTPLPLTTAAAQVFEMARLMGYGSDDDASIARFYERVCNQEIR
jgi:L-threonate 2-dehydrogenase